MDSSYSSDRSLDQSLYQCRPKSVTTPILRPSQAPLAPQLNRINRISAEMNISSSSLSHMSSLTRQPSQPPSLASHIPSRPANTILHPPSALVPTSLLESSRILHNGVFGNVNANANLSPTPRPISQPRALHTQPTHAPSSAPTRPLTSSISSQAPSAAGNVSAHVAGVGSGSSGQPPRLSRPQQQQQQRQQLQQPQRQRQMGIGVGPVPDAGAGITGPGVGANGHVRSNTNVNANVNTTGSASVDAGASLETVQLLLDAFKNKVKIELDLNLDLIQKKTSSLRKDVLDYVDDAVESVSGSNAARDEVWKQQLVLMQKKVECLVDDRITETRGDVERLNTLLLDVQAQCNALSSQVLTSPLFPEKHKSGTSALSDEESLLAANLHTQIIELASATKFEIGKMKEYVNSRLQQQNDSLLDAHTLLSQLLSHHTADKEKSTATIRELFSKLREEQNSHIDSGLHDLRILHSDIACEVESLTRQQQLLMQQVKKIEQQPVPASLAAVTRLEQRTQDALVQCKTHIRTMERKVQLILENSGDMNPGKMMGSENTKETPASKNSGSLSMGVAVEMADKLEKVELMKAKVLRMDTMVDTLQSRQNELEQLCRQLRTNFKDFSEKEIPGLISEKLNLEMQMVKNTREQERSEDKAGRDTETKKIYGYVDTMRLNVETAMDTVTQGIVAQLQQFREKLQSEEKNRMENSEDVSQQLQDMRVSVNSVVSKLDDNNDKVGVVGQQYEQLSAQTQTIGDTLADIHDHIAITDNAVADVQQRVISLTQDTTDIHERVRKIDSEVEVAITSATALDARVSSLEQQCTDIPALVSSVQAMRQRLGVDTNGGDDGDDGADEGSNGRHGRRQGDDVSARVSAVEHHQANMSERVASLEEQQVGMNDRVLALEQGQGAVTLLTEAMDAHHEVLNELSDKMDLVEERMHEVETHAQQVQGQAAVWDRIEGRISVQEKKVEEHEKILKVLSEKVDMSAGVAEVVRNKGEVEEAEREGEGEAGGRGQVDKTRLSTSTGTGVRGVAARGGALGSSGKVRVDREVSVASGRDRESDGEQEVERPSAQYAAMLEDVQGRLQQHNDVLKQHQHDTVQRHEALEQRCSALEDSHADVTAKYADVVHRCTSVEEICTTLTRECGVLRDQHDGVVELCQRLQVQCGSVASRRAEVDEQYTDVTRKYTDISEKYVEISEKCVSLSSVCALTEQRCEEVREVCVDVGARCDALERRMGEHADEVDRHTLTLTQHDEAIQAYGETVQQHAGALQEYGASIREHGDALARHTDAIGQHSNAIQEHSAVLDQHSTAIEQHAGMLHVLQATVATMQSQDKEAANDAEDKGMVNSAAIAKSGLLPVVATVEAAAVADVRVELKREVRREVLDTVRAEVEEEMQRTLAAERERHRAELVALAREMVLGEVADMKRMLAAQVREEVVAQVRAEVKKEIYEEVKEQIREEIFQDLRQQFRDDLLRNMGEVTSLAPISEQYTRDTPEKARNLGNSAFPGIASPETTLNIEESLNLSLSESFPSAPSENTRPALDETRVSAAFPIASRSSSTSAREHPVAAVDVQTTAATLAATSTSSASPTSTYTSVPEQAAENTTSHSTPLTAAAMANTAYVPSAAAMAAPVVAALSSRDVETTDGSGTHAMVNSETTDFSTAGVEAIADESGDAEDLDVYTDTDIDSDSAMIVSSAPILASPAASLPAPPSPSTATAPVSTVAGATTATSATVMSATATVAAATDATHEAAPHEDTAISVATDAGTAPNTVVDAAAATAASTDVASRARAALLASIRDVHARLYAPDNTSPLYATDVLFDAHTDTPTPSHSHAHAANDSRQPHKPRQYAASADDDDDYDDFDFDLGQEDEEVVVEAGPVRAASQAAISTNPKTTTPNRVTSPALVPPALPPLTVPTDATSPSASATNSASGDGVGGVDLGTVRAITTDELRAVRARMIMQTPLNTLTEDQVEKLQNMEIEISEKDVSEKVEVPAVMAVSEGTVAVVVGGDEHAPTVDQHVPNMYNHADDVYDDDSDYGLLEAIFGADEDEDADEDADDGNSSRMDMSGPSVAATVQYVSDGRRSHFDGAVGDDDDDDAVSGIPDNLYASGVHVDARVAAPGATPVAAPAATGTVIAAVAGTPPIHHDDNVDNTSDDNLDKSLDVTVDATFTTDLSLSLLSDASAAHTHIPIPNVHNTTPAPKTAPSSVPVLATLPVPTEPAPTLPITDTLAYSDENVNNHDDSRDDTGNVSLTATDEIMAAMADLADVNVLERSHSEEGDSENTEILELSENSENVPISGKLDKSHVRKNSRQGSFSPVRPMSDIEARFRESLPISPLSGPTFPSSPARPSGGIANASGGAAATGLGMDVGMGVATSVPEVSFADTHSSSFTSPSLAHSIAIPIESLRALAAPVTVTKIPIPPLPAIADLCVQAVAEESDGDMLAVECELALQARLRAQRDEELVRIARKVERERERGRERAQRERTAAAAVANAEPGVEGVVVEQDYDYGVDGDGGVVDDEDMEGGSLLSLGSFAMSSSHDTPRIHTTANSADTSHAQAPAHHTRPQASTTTAAERAPTNADVAAGTRMDAKMGVKAEGSMLSLGESLYSELPSTMDSELQYTEVEIEEDVEVEEGLVELEREASMKREVVGNGDGGDATRPHAMENGNVTTIGNFTAIGNLTEIPIMVDPHDSLSAAIWTTKEADKMYKQDTTTMFTTPVDNINERVLSSSSLDLTDLTMDTSTSTNNNTNPNNANTSDNTSNNVTHAGHTSHDNSHPSTYIATDVAVASATASTTTVATNATTAAAPTPDTEVDVKADADEDEFVFSDFEEDALEVLESLHSHSHSHTNSQNDSQPRLDTHDVSVAPSQSHSSTASIVDLTETSLPENPQNSVSLEKPGKIRAVENTSAVESDPVLSFDHTSISDELVLDEILSDDNDADNDDHSDKFVDNVDKRGDSVNKLLTDKPIPGRIDASRLAMVANIAGMGAGAGIGMGLGGGLTLAQLRKAKEERERAGTEAGSAHNLAVMTTAGAAGAGADAGAITAAIHMSDDDDGAFPATATRPATQATAGAQPANAATSVEAGSISVHMRKPRVAAARRRPMSPLPSAFGEDASSFESPVAATPTEPVFDPELEADAEATVVRVHQHMNTSASSDASGSGSSSVASNVSAIAHGSSACTLYPDTVHDDNVYNNPSYDDNPYNDAAYDDNVYNDAPYDDNVYNADVSSLLTLETEPDTVDDSYDTSRQVPVPTMHTSGNTLNSGRTQTSGNGLDMHLDADASAGALTERGYGYGGMGAHPEHGDHSDSSPPFSPFSPFSPASPYVDATTGAGMGMGTGVDMGPHAFVTPNGKLAKIPHSLGKGVSPARSPPSTHFLLGEMPTQPLPEPTYLPPTPAKSGKLDKSGSFDNSDQVDQSDEFAIPLGISSTILPKVNIRKNPHNNSSSSNPRDEDSSFGAESLDFGETIDLVGNEHFSFNVANPQTAVTHALRSDIADSVELTFGDSMLSLDHIRDVRGDTTVTAPVRYEDAPTQRGPTPAAPGAMKTDVTPEAEAESGEAVVFRVHDSVDSMDNTHDGNLYNDIDNLYKSRDDKNVKVPVDSLTSVHSGKNIVYADNPDSAYHQESMDLSLSVSTFGSVEDATEDDTPLPTAGMHTGMGGMSASVPYRQPLPQLSSYAHLHPMTPPLPKQNARVGKNASIPGIPLGMGIPNSHNAVNMSDSMMSADDWIDEEDFVLPGMDD